LASGIAAHPNPAPSSWDSLADDYFDQIEFKYQPTAGTAAGFHQYDAQLEDYSRRGVDAETAAKRAFEKRVEAFDPKSLDPTRTADRELLLSSLRGDLLNLETIRPWEKNPDTYSSGITESVFGIMSRTFASPDDRLRSVVAREKQMPAALAAARENLKNPPLIFTQVAIEQLPGIVDFFQHDVPEAFAKATDPQVKSDFAQSNAAVIKALGDYQAWLQTTVLPQSHGDFRLGAVAFSKKLLYEEMVDIPLDRLLEIGKADLHRNQAEFERIAKELDPAKTPQEVLAELAADHTTPDHLLQTFRDTFASLVGFIQQKHIITIPSEVRPIVEETPPFMRALTFASMDTPGPYETHATEAYFNVTLPDPHATPAEIEGHMAEFNRGTVVSTAAHEAYPGHYVQFLWMPQAPSKIRKLIGAASNAEGWAHYCEQMMLDEGYGQPGVGAKDARESKLLRLGQLQDALLRDARFVVGIEMHTGHMTFPQGIDFFVKEGYQTREAGMVETKRGTSDATYLYYTLGKLEIMKLREDLKKKEGPAFSLETFHNDFMKQGFPPIKIVRRALMGDNSPTL
jgi:uncharacterized protein (DUF885 family)